MRISFIIVALMALPFGSASASTVAAFGSETSFSSTSTQGDNHAKPKKKKKKKKSSRAVKKHMKKHKAKSCKRIHRDERRGKNNYSKYRYK